MLPGKLATHNLQPLSAWSFAKTALKEAVASCKQPTTQQANNSRVKQASNSGTSHIRVSSTGVKLNASLTDVTCHTVALTRCWSQKNVFCEQAWTRLTAGMTPLANSLRSSFSRGVVLISMRRSARCRMVPPHLRPIFAKASFNTSAPVHQNIGVSEQHSRVHMPVCAAKESVLQLYTLLSTVTANISTAVSKQEVQTGFLSLAWQCVK